MTPIPTTLLALALSAQGVQSASADDVLWGHSAHGPAHDEGPRQAPWPMDHIGSTPFPVTAGPEVQRWFDQGVALLHGFWWYEAERAFRWCVKLEPDCAMAYWGLAMTAANGPRSERALEFLDAAEEHLAGATEKERRIVAATRAVLGAMPRFGPGPGVPGDKDDEDARADALRALDLLVMDFPDCVEVRAFYWPLASRLMGPQGELARLGFEALLDDVLEQAPDHVGALHYRVHNWDGEDGRYVLDDCLRLGDLAPECGHLLHMPGHVLSSIGLWHEAAIAMDRATRVEKAYMHERRIVPEDNWDYAHNLDYLCYIQEQLGMADAAAFGAQQLLRGPGFADAPFFESLIRSTALRGLLKFERWDEVLEPERPLFDRADPLQSLLADYGAARARLGRGELVV